MFRNGSWSMPFGSGESPIERKLSSTVSLTGHERTFAETDIIVSKTDLKGRVTYANRTFLDIAGMSEGQALGAAHSVIRHPDMPRAVFKLLWDRLQGGKEIFAYVVNMAVNGDHYWVFAHVTPTLDERGNIIGYHSSRRVPRRSAVDEIKALYGRLNEIERASSRGDGMENAARELANLLQSRNTTYDRYIFSLQG